MFFIHRCAEWHSQVHVFYLEDYTNIFQFYFFCIGQQNLLASEHFSSLRNCNWGPLYINKSHKKTISFLWLRVAGSIGTADLWALGHSSLSQTRGAHITDFDLKFHEASPCPVRDNVFLEFTDHPGWFLHVTPFTQVALRWLFADCPRGGQERNTEAWLL